jgi:hypothetical protein
MSATTLAKLGFSHKGSWQIIVLGNTRPLLPLERRIAENPTLAILSLNPSSRGPVPDRDVCEENHQGTGAGPIELHLVPFLISPLHRLLSVELGRTGGYDVSRGTKYGACLTTYSTQMRQPVSSPSWANGLRGLSRGWSSLCCVWAAFKLQDSQCVIKPRIIVSV